MFDFNFLSFLNLLAALFASMGGATIIIIALSKWFGEFMSQKLLGKYKNQHEKELETLKGLYTKELEATKVELEKAKSLFLRYSEKQFDLYNDLWRVLVYTKDQADLLWKNLTPENIPSFAEQIRIAKNAIIDNMLLIEGQHYDNLLKLIDQFEQFSFGKYKLVDIMNDNNQSSINITQEEVENVVSINMTVKDNYDKLLLKIGVSFRDQIKG